MKASFLSSPFARVALRTLGLAPLDREFKLRGDLSDMERILFVGSGQLSDILFHLPLMARIHERWPGLELQVLVEEGWAEFLRREEMLSGLLVYRGDQLRARSSSYYRLLKEVRDRNFDAVFLMGEEADGPRDLVAYASQAPLRVGVFQPQRESMLNCMLRWQGQDRYKMEMPGELSRIFGLSYDPDGWRFEARPEEQRAADQMIHFRKPIGDQLLIAVDPGVGKGHGRLAVDSLGYLVNHISEQLRAKVLFLHLPGAEANAAELMRLLRGEVLDMPRQGLRETLALLTRCNLFLSGNTELFHVAVAAGVPALGLFTEGDGKRWEPRRHDSVAILRGRPGEKISLQEIDTAVEGILHARTS
jgi:heptosyltransferase II